MNKYKYNRGSLMHFVMEHTITKYRNNKIDLCYYQIFDKGKEKSRIGVGTWVRMPVRDVILFYARFHCKNNVDEPLAWWGLNKEEILDIKNNARIIAENERFVK